MDEFQSPKKVYTVDDIMEILQVKRKTVHDWIKDGKMKAVRVGKQLRIPIEYYEEFIRENTIDNTASKK